MQLNLLRIEKITRYIFLKSKIEKADLAFVFGTRNPEAVKRAVEIYNRNLVPLILITGGLNRVTGKIEAYEMAGKMISLGVKKKDILLEDKSTNTLENVLFSKKTIEERIGFNNISTILVVVKHYHSRRALMTLKKHFPSTIKFLPVTYKICGFAKDDWFKKEKGRKKILGEVEKIKRYLKKGDIGQLDS